MWGPFRKKLQLLAMQEGVGVSPMHLYRQAQIINWPQKKAVAGSGIHLLVFVSCLNDYRNKNPSKIWRASCCRVFKTKEYSAGAIHRKFANLFGVMIIIKGVVNNWFCSFKCGQTNMYDKESSGRPSVVNIYRPSTFCLATFKWTNLIVYKFFARNL